MTRSRDFIFFFMFIMPMLCSSSEVDFQLDPSQPTENDFQLDPAQPTEEDLQLDPLQLVEDDFQLEETQEELSKSTPYAETKYGKNTCPSGYGGIFNEEECRKAMKATSGKRWCGSHAWHSIQKGCFSHPNRCIWFNRHKTGRTHGAFSSICKSESGCPGGWPQIKQLAVGGSAKITAKSGAECAAKCNLQSPSTCGSFKFTKDSQECIFNTWSQSVSSQPAKDKDPVTCKRVFSERAPGSACPNEMKYAIADEKTCKGAAAALGKKWGSASFWNTIPAGCSIRSADGSAYFNKDAEGPASKTGFSDICSAIPIPVTATPPPPSTTMTTTPSLTSVCSAGVCTKGKWAIYESGKTEADCKAKCEEGRSFVSVPEGVQEDVYEFRQNGRFHDVTARMPSTSKQVKNINYRQHWNYWPGWTVRDQFYARWSGYIEIKTAGKYTFNSASGDGSRLFMDDKLLVSNPGWHNQRDKRGSVEMKAGKHKFSLEMFEGGGHAAMIFKYSGPDTANKEIVVPDTVFSRTLTGSATKVLNPEWKEAGMCQAYSHNGDECVIYTACTEVGADQDSLVCEDNSLNWVKPSALTTCKY